MPYDKLAHGEPRVVPFPQMEHNESRLFSRALAAIALTALMVFGLASLVVLAIAAVWP